jgi:hypothetical protein
LSPRPQKPALFEKTAAVYCVIVSAICVERAVLPAVVAIMTVVVTGFGFDNSTHQETANLLPAATTHY